MNDNFDKNRKLLLGPKPAVFRTEQVLSDDYRAGAVHLKNFIIRCYRQTDLTPNGPLDAGMRLKLVDIDAAQMLEDIDFTRYVDSEGVKVTKKVRPILSYMGMDRKQIEYGWERLCTHIGDMYLQEANYLAYFGDKSMLGNGLYEGRETCFRDEGENAHHKYWLTANRRAQVLVLQRVMDSYGTIDNHMMQEMIVNPYTYKTDGIGRCIVWFHGGRQVSLMNQYEYRTRIHNEMYATGIKHLFNWHDAVFRKAHDYVNRMDIYLNDKPDMLSDKKSTFDLKHYIRVRCTCGSFHGNTTGWCSTDCRNECSGEECSECGEMSQEVQDWNIERNQFRMCQNCFENVTGYCDSCDETYWQDDITYVGSIGSSYCNSCLDEYTFTCEMCDSIYDMNCHHVIDDKYLCESCSNDHTHMCEKCEDQFFNEDINQEGMCSSCQEDVDDEENSEAVA